tara:strand:- start:128 stop:1006 length:879 start_codon:yes stop_codon:yes gene_type:complete
MSNYSIADLEKLSGIKSHTIRIWEKRYNLLLPDRTDTNIRTYDDKQLRKILNVSLLVDKGLKISKIAKMDMNEIADKVSFMTMTDDDYKSQINRLIIDSLEFNESGFKEIVNDLIKKIGFSNTFKNVLLPLLNKLGVLWTTGEIYPANEHFLSSLVTRKISSSIDQIEINSLNKSTVLLFTPPWENHNFALLYAEFLFRQAGHKTVNIGLSISIESIEMCIKKINPSIIFTTFIVGQKQNKIQLFVDELWSNRNKSKLLIAGNTFLTKLIKTDAIKFYDIESFEFYLKNIKE